MTEILLDHRGDATCPSGYRVIVSEVDFLRYALHDPPLLIRGQNLCYWAEVFYRGRRIITRDILSPQNALSRAFPLLSEREIVSLAAYIKDKIDIINLPDTASEILNQLFPLPLWQGQPSITHGAEWLIWLCQTDINESLQPLLKKVAYQWHQSSDLSINYLYSVYFRDEACRLIENWLGIGDRENFPIKQEFPISFPTEFIERARSSWRKQIINSQGSFFISLEKLHIPFKLKQLAANETYQYFVNNPRYLTRNLINLLAKYLGTNQFAHLQTLIPPSAPSSLPIEIEGVLAWYQNEYLPYREWQHFCDHEGGLAQILQSSKEFALWFLDQYPNALVGGTLYKWIGFNKINELVSDSDCLILIVILDGLGSIDARFLLQRILYNSNRIRVADDGYIFTSIPTVTQFAKNALLKGVPPDKVNEVDPLGTILPDNKFPAHEFRTAQSGQLYFWRVREPDYTYHKNNTSENLRSDIEGRLEAVAKNIQKIVEDVPDNLMLQIIITSDHGRLLGKTLKKIPVPKGMESHGRAAWGHLDKSFPEKGFSIEEKIIYLMGERFGLPVDVALPLDQRAFRGSDDRTGSEHYPHGGLFPEEVIVPWFVLARDDEIPNIEVVITGKGRARKSGVLHLKILNLGDLDLTLEQVAISIRDQLIKTFDISREIKARSDQEIQLQLESWPSHTEINDTGALVQVRPPDQRVYEIPVKVEIQSEDIYTRREDILEDLIDG